MKYRILLSLTLVFSCTLISAGAQGIVFETGTWAEVVAKAKKENKLIYMDIYATWCGPCKAMAANVFPDQRAGDKYNAMFINYKVDAEKGEGRTIARKYSVSAYPTNLYINPKDESVVYKIAGGCGVEEFLARADIAQGDFTDPMSWDDYNKKLKADPGDKAFLNKYLAKAARLDKNTDMAINLYVEHHIQMPPSDEDLIFLMNNVQTLDNKGYALLSANEKRVDSLVKDPRYRVSEREKTTWFQGLFKKAIAAKDIQILSVARPVIDKYSSQDGEGRWYNMEQQFYNALEDKESLYRSFVKGAEYYSKFTDKQIADKDNAILQDNITALRAQLASQNLQEDKIQQYIEARKKSQNGFEKGFSASAISMLQNAIGFSLEYKGKDKKTIKKIQKWNEKLMSLYGTSHPNQHIGQQYEALILYRLGKKEDAIKELQELIAVQQSKKSDTKAIEELLTKIQSGAL